MPITRIFYRLIKTSRPKFWHYAAGPFALAAIPVLRNHPTLFLPLLLTFLWVLFFGNFFIYGINDLSDQDTDAYNQKKNDQDEVKLQEVEQIYVKIALIVSVLMILPILIFPLAAFFCLCFLFFSWQYSAKPIRAKSKPFLDGVFNLLYILPACISLSFQPGTNFEAVISSNWHYLLAGIFWCMAMHAFSAIPDIEADQKANLKTTAVFLGRKKTLIYCLLCYLIGAGILILCTYPLAALLFAPYFLLLSMLYFQKDSAISSFYKYFPKINLLMGTVIFFLILLI